MIDIFIEPLYPLGHEGSNQTTPRVSNDDSRKACPNRGRKDPRYQPYRTRVYTAVSYESYPYSQGTPHQGRKPLDRVDYINKSVVNKSVHNIPYAKQFLDYLIYHILSISYINTHLTYLLRQVKHFLCIDGHQSWLIAGTDTLEPTPKGCMT